MLSSLEPVLDKLPAELLLKVFNQLPTWDLYAVALTCKRLRPIAAEALYTTVKIKEDTRVFQFNPAYIDELMNLFQPKSLMKKKMPAAMWAILKKGIVKARMAMKFEEETKGHISLWRPLIQTPVAKLTKELFVVIVQQNLRPSRLHRPSDLYAPLRLLLSNFEAVKLTRLGINHQLINEVFLFGSLSQLSIEIHIHHLDVALPDLGAGMPLRNLKHLSIEVADVCLGSAWIPERKLNSAHSNLIGVICWYLCNFQFIETFSLSACPLWQISNDPIPLEAGFAAHDSLSPSIGILFSDLKLENLKELKLRLSKTLAIWRLPLPTTANNAPVDQAGVEWITILTAFLNRHPRQLDKIEWEAPMHLTLAVNTTAATPYLFIENPIVDEVFNNATELLLDVAAAAADQPDRESGYVTLWCRDLVQGMRHHIKKLALAPRGMLNRWQQPPGLYWQMVYPDNLRVLTFLEIKDIMMDMVGECCNSDFTKVLPAIFGVERGITEAIPPNLEHLKISIWTHKVCCCNKPGELSGPVETAKHFFEHAKSLSRFQIEWVYNPDTLKIELDQSYRLEIVRSPVDYLESRPHFQNRHMRLSVWQLCHLPKHQHSYLTGYAETHLKVDTYRGPNVYRWELEEEEVVKIRRCKVNKKGGCDRLLMAKGVWVPESFDVSVSETWGIRAEDWELPEDQDEEEEVLAFDDVD